MSKISIELTLRGHDLYFTSGQRYQNSWNKSHLRAFEDNSNLILAMYQFPWPDDLTLGHIGLNFSENVYHTRPSYTVYKDTP